MWGSSINAAFCACGREGFCLFECLDFRILKKIPLLKTLLSILKVRHSCQYVSLEKKKGNNCQIIIPEGCRNAVLATAAAFHPDFAERDAGHYPGLSCCFPVLMYHRLFLLGSVSKEKDHFWLVWKICPRVLKGIKTSYFLATFLEGS